MRVARSASGDLRDPWTQRAENPAASDGGHQVSLCHLSAGEPYLVIHRPDDTSNERAELVALTEGVGRLCGGD